MRVGRRTAGALLAFALAAAPAFAGDLPEARVPHGLGVNVHFTAGHDTDLDLIAAAGVKVVRMDLFWHATEKVRGEYDWSDYDRLADGLAKRGLRPLFILDYSNPLHEESIVSIDARTKRERKDPRSPEHEESVAAFARWAAAAARHFRDRNALWEIWNEPNGFWRPKPDATRYATLARAAARSVREADPNATIVAPATSGFPWDYLETVFASGLLDDLDGVTVHPYRATPPETAAEDYRRLRRLLDRHPGKDGRDVPILSGEWGYPTHTGGVAPDLQGAYLVRQQLVNLLEGVRLSVWYDWKDDGPDPSVDEFRFGTVTTSLEPKPSYVAMRTFSRVLAENRVVGRLDAGHDEVYALLCVAPSGDQTIAVWTTGSPATAAIPIGDVADGVLAVLGLLGSDAAPARAEQGVLRVEVDAHPRYVRLKPASAALAVEAALEVEVARRGLVETRRPEAIEVAVRLRNPLDTPLRLRASLEPVPSKPNEVDILPGGIGEAGNVRPWPHRDLEPDLWLRVEVLVLSASGAWLPLRVVRRTLSLTLADPLHVSVAPTVSGFRLEVRDPAGTFQGTARGEGWSKPVRMEDGATSTVVDLPAASGEAQRSFRGAALFDERDVAVANVPALSFRWISVSAFAAALDGDATVPAKARVSDADSPADGSRPPPFPGSWRVDYEFGAGWRFFRLVPSTRIPTGVPIGGRPAAVAAWVFGDGSHGTLRARVVDAARQTFQATGPVIDWKGWRWVTIPLGDLRLAEHWGGPNDGVARGQLSWECPLLLDGPRTPVAGTLFVSGLCTIDAETR